MIKPVRAILPTVSMIQMSQLVMGLVLSCFFSQVNHWLWVSPSACVSEYL